MYFRAQNGSFKRVPQIPNRFLNGESGGMTIYYTSPYDGAKVTAFKPGFRMLAGDAGLRVKAGITKWNAICFRCYNAKNFGGDNGAPCSDSTVDTVELPKKVCPGGIRTTVRFPDVCPSAYPACLLVLPDCVSCVSLLATLSR